MQIAAYIGAIVWIIGFAVLIAYGIVASAKLNRRISEAVFFKDNIYLSENVISLFMIGFIKPKIPINRLFHTILLL